jgi:hypothetical protein
MKRMTQVIILVAVLVPTANSQAAALGFADVILDYFDSGAGPLAGPYGGTIGGSAPVPVPVDVVVGDEPGPTGFADFLSLPSGSFVTVGFTDETIVDGPGNDIFIREIGAGGERASVFVSSDLINFVFLGVAQDNTSTSLDLASIGFTNPVTAIKIVGLDSRGGSPGFDVVNVQVLPGSIGPAPIPEPATIFLLGIGVSALGAFVTVKRMRRAP